MLGKVDRAANEIPADAEDLVVLGTLSEVARAFPRVKIPTDLLATGYWLHAEALNGRNLMIIASPEPAGVLYGTFRVLEMLAQNEPLEDLEIKSNPAATIRWVNQWDNLDGSIERGYAGRSIFFENNNVVPDLTRVAQYARLLASSGINGCTINNVNANTRVLTPEFLPQLVRVADVFRPWGVQLSISVDLGSPKTIGGLTTFDPLDPTVAAWWSAQVDAIYRAIPDFGGFVLKADSEGRVGPSTYHRSHADAANVLAAALKPHGGMVIYRGFVYDHHADWHNLKFDRARAAYDNFRPLDGKFAGNAAVQIKYGPIDFQAREPVSPLIGALPHTNKTIELQITQEYTGQQRHLCYLVPMWKQMLDFDLHVDGGQTPVKHLVSGFVGVANVGRDATWLGNAMAMANLYGFGKLAWNPEATARQITETWTRLTFGLDPLVVSTVTSLQLDSWRVYEEYTGPLGVGTLTDILHGHYGPGIETAERNGWGQWIRADNNGIGMDRTVATGTGFIGQYPPMVAHMYESLATCPESLLLFMHHVPYNYVLHSGRSLVQYIYDSHYAAAAEAQKFATRWQALRGRVDEARYQPVLAMLRYQAGHAIVWRDAICSWFLRQSGIADQQNRAGHFPCRTEAEAMNLLGYRPMDVSPWEDASGGKGVTCAAASCSAEFTYTGASGWRTIHVQYFDLNPGSATFSLAVNNQTIASWTASEVFPTKAPNGDTSTRFTVEGVALRPGDRIHITGKPDGDDKAAFDYVEIPTEP
jgi:alpha-glucuronidase